MKKNGKTSTRIIEQWVRFVQRNAPMVMLAIAFLTAGILYYSIRNFSINPELTGMISEKLHFRQVEKAFSSAFPNLSNTIVVVIDAQSADLAVSTRKRLSERLEGEKTVFRTVFEPGGGEFFEKNGLLYLSVEELQDFADNMASVQPLLGFLSEELSLRNLFYVLGQALTEPEAGAFEEKRILALFDYMGLAIDSAIEGRPYMMPWQEVMLGEKEAAGQRRQYIIIEPHPGLKLAAGEVPLNTVKRVARELGIDDKSGVRLRVTGELALNQENMAEVKKSIGAATLVSFLLVALIIYVGLWRSPRLILGSITTLLIGLVWTTGFAVAFIGSLNMISITFAVLFIGLGIDYSIQYCLRYRELLASGNGNEESAAIAARGTGRGLLLSCITTAIGFYSFLPTAYAGVAELGLISGTGMFISFFATLTVLPAMLAILPFKKLKHGKPLPERVLSVPYKFPRLIGAAALFAGVASVVALPRIYFDYNPLNLYNPESEPVETVKELFKDPMSTPWTASVLASGTAEAKSLSERLGKLKEVKTALTILDFVAQDQKQKAEIISSMALFMPPVEGVTLKPSACSENAKALNGFEKLLNERLLSLKEAAYASVAGLTDRIRRLKLVHSTQEARCRSLNALEGNMLSGFPGLFKSLSLSLQAEPFGVSDLPDGLVSQYVSRTGLYRIQVFPSENMLDTVSLERFVKSLYSVTNQATDSPVIIYEAGNAVISSFQKASLYALGAITVFLLFEMRSVLITVLILVPLALSVAVTGALSVLLDISLNFANVIVVPLVLGVGVHSGILFTLRYMTEPPSHGNMLKTSTTRAMLFSFLTVLTSSASLAFSPHRGVSSIGILFTISFALLIAATVVLLPALFELFKARLEAIREKR